MDLPIIISQMRVLLVIAGASLRCMQNYIATLPFVF